MGLGFTGSVFKVLVWASGFRLGLEGAGVQLAQGQSKTLSPKS